MKIKLLFLMLFLMSEHTFSQTKKLIVGRVVCKNLFVVADIINPDSKEMRVTNDKGEFSILVKTGDVLVFIADNYEYYRIQLSQEEINKSNLVISLTKKPIALKEVLIKKNTVSPLAKNSQKYVDGQYFDDRYSSPTNKLVYDGSIENGLDFVRMGKELIKLFKKKKGYDKKKVKEINFKEFSTTTFNEKFFTETLQLHEDEVALFLEFCTTDPKSKLIVDEKNIMGVMDFYITKNEEYKKISSQTLFIKSK